MADATSQVLMEVGQYNDTKIQRDLESTAQTYYTGAMIAMDASGYATKCDDNAGLIFDGIMCDSVPIVVPSGASAGDFQVNVEKPFRFSAFIASAALTDIGRAVYAKYDNEVAYSGVSNSILVGWVEAYLDATHVLIRPSFANITLAVTSNLLTFAGTTGNNQIKFPDNLADGLSIAEGANEYLTFTSTNSSELITAKEPLLVNVSSAIAFEVGPNGATNPTLKVVTNVSSEAGGLSITGAADNVGVALAALGSNTNEPLKLDGKGSGLISIGTVSTGGAVVRKATSTVAAANNSITTGTALPEGYVYVTGANGAANNACVLPASVAGKEVTVKNTANAVLCVFPPVSSAINAAAANAVYNVAAYADRTFHCATTTQWYTSPETIA